MWELDQTWILYCDYHDGSHVKVNGRTVQRVLSPDEVMALKVSIVALSVGYCMYMYEYLGQSDWPELIQKVSKSEEKRSLSKTKTCLL